MSATVTTDGGGTASFSLATPAAVAGGQFVTATATDSSGNTSEFSAAVAASAFTLTGVKGLEKSATNAPIASITVTLSQAIEPSSFDGHSVLLTRNGGPNLIKRPVTVTPLGGGSYAIGGLSALTAAEGFYTFTIDAAALKDAGGLHGTGSISRGWVMDTTAPTATVSPLSKVGTSLGFVVTINGTDPAGRRRPRHGDRLVHPRRVDQRRELEGLPAADPGLIRVGQYLLGQGELRRHEQHVVRLLRQGHRLRRQHDAVHPWFEASTYLPDLTPPVTQVNPAGGANPSRWPPPRARSR